jgi:UDP-N-acetylmuramoyl-L-alanyl-D-glutamate--2,6-diaminopimelate ligase
VKLSQLLQNVSITEMMGELPETVGQLRFDSRKVEAGDVFVAMRGTAFDGHHYIETAVEKGAALIVCEWLPKTYTATVPVLEVKNSAQTLGQMAANYYGQPSEGMHVIGVTGTNGKTTVTTLLWQCFTALGYKCGLMGTVENRIGAEVSASTHTTPDAVQVQGLLRRMADAGCSYVFMEVSSHATHQHRVGGIRFAGAVFLNLTHDHLDYHGTFAAYRDAKKMLFDDLTAEAFALTNADDRNGAFMLQNTAAAKHTFGVKSPADYKSKILESHLTGTLLQMDDTEVYVRLIGDFNVSNLTAVYGVARLLGADKAETLTVLSNLTGAEGRFEYVVHPKKQDCIAIVDYAHTPDALEKVLTTIYKLKKRNAKIITVTGAGGDRDKTKRPEMARIAGTYSDHLILTNDNPRTEDPAAILRDMEAGLDGEGRRKTLTIENREQAIKTAERLAQSGDVVLIAGKGHEKYQEINGVKHYFDDKAMIVRMMNDE